MNLHSFVTFHGNFAFFLVKLVHTLVKFLCGETKGKVTHHFWIFFWIFISDSSQLQLFHDPKNFYGSSAHSQDQVLLTITKILSRYVITDITLFDSLFCP